MLHYRIFISELGKFQDSDKYIFVAEFAVFKEALRYVQMLAGRKPFDLHDIIFKEVDDKDFNNKDGKVVGVINALGEGLNVEEYEFK